MTFGLRLAGLMIGLMAVAVPVPAATAVVNVFDNTTLTYGTPATVDLTAHLGFARVETEFGNVYLQLFPGKTPLTVQNFLKYASDGDYANTFIHRSVPGFIIQGGGYHVANSAFEHIATDPAVQNEPGISNIRGTIAMAKLGSDPNSATSEWFFNLADNSANLDTQNSGFTVFGRVIGSGMTYVDQIAALTRYNLSKFGTAFSEMPLENYDGGGTLYLTNLVMILAVQQVTPVQYTTSVGDTSLLTAAVNQGQLVLTPTWNKAGTTTVTVQTTVVNGVAATETFSATVPEFVRLDLKPGWNLVALPFNSIITDTPATALTDTNGTALTVSPALVWDGIQQKYVEQSTRFIAKQAFWVNGTAGATLTRPIVTDGTAVSSEIPLFTGWNLIGTPRDIALAALSDEARSLLTFWIWDAANQRFTGLTSGAVLRRGQGCLIGLFSRSTYTLTVP